VLLIAPGPRLAVRSRSDFENKGARMELVLCSGCERHVKKDERACPFCGAQRRAFAAKAGIVAGIALSLAVAGCENAQPAYGLPPPDLGVDSGMTPLYGAPDLGLADASATDSGLEDAAIVPLYGPAPTDAGPDASQVDSGFEDASVIALYGPAPADAGMAGAYGPPPSTDAG
jgi:hypothetical protein